MFISNSQNNEFKKESGLLDAIANFFRAVGYSTTPKGKRDFLLMLTFAPLVASAAGAYVTHLNPDILYKKPRRRDSSEEREEYEGMARELIEELEESHGKKKEEREKEEKEEDTQTYELKIGSLCKSGFLPLLIAPFTSPGLFFGWGVAKPFIENFSPAKGIRKVYVRAKAKESEKEYKRELSETLALSKILKGDIDFEDLRVLPKETVAEIVVKLEKRTGLPKKDILQRIYIDEEKQASWFIPGLAATGAMVGIWGALRSMQEALSAQADIGAEYSKVLDRFDPTSLSAYYEEEHIPSSDIFIEAKKKQRQFEESSKRRKQSEELSEEEKKNILKKMKPTAAKTEGPEIITTGEEDEEKETAKLISKLEKYRKNLKQDLEAPKGKKSRKPKIL